MLSTYDRSESDITRKKVILRSHSTWEVLGGILSRMINQFLKLVYLITANTIYMFIYVNNSQYYLYIKCIYMDITTHNGCIKLNIYF